VEGASARHTVGWRVRGRVQGVGFRWFVAESAREIGVAGDVRNLPDGHVEIRARGTPEQLVALRAAVLRGPVGARVDRLEELPGAVEVESVEFRICP